ncbi:immune inhibitor A, partial [bacterium]|nr:immune inhibitor A [bacterium]
EPLKVTLVWTDCPGAPFANPALVNDLDLIIENGNLTYHGNEFSGGWSVSGDTMDSLNNVENVFIKNPSSISKVTIRAFNIAGDGVPDHSGLDQDFALFISNGVVKSSKGTISFDRKAYRCNDVIEITLKDSDLQGTGSQTIKVKNITKGKEISINLQEVDSDGIFNGKINTTPQEDGGIFVSHNDILQALYIDADDGIGGKNVTVTKDASIDCEGPSIIDIEILGNDSDKARVNILTDESSNAVLTFWADGIEKVSIQSSLNTMHSFNLENLESCTNYFMYFYLEDILQNSRVDDNKGENYSFETLRDAIALFDDAESVEFFFTHSSLNNGDDLWHITSRENHSPSQSWFCGYQSGGYSPELADVLVSKVLDIKDESKLSFWTKYEIESDYDFGYVEIKGINNSEWENITPGGHFTGSSNGWIYMELQLSGYKGKVQVRFRQTSDESESNDGWYIDDIKVGKGVPCHAGDLTFDKDIYGCTSSPVNIELVDIDLDINKEASDSITIPVTSFLSNNSINVTLNEENISGGIFTGTCYLSDEINSNGNVLHVEDQDRITVSYIDENDGLGNSREITDSALTDCSRPEISSIQVLMITSKSAVITWFTSKAGTSEVYYGIDSNLPNSAIIEESKSFHVVNLENLDSCSQYCFKVKTVDDAGNEMVDDNDGRNYSFTTLGGVVTFSERGESSSNSWTTDSLSSGLDGNLWHISQRRSYSGKGSWYCGSELTGSYNDDMDNVLISPTFKIIGESSLSFYYYSDFHDPDDYGKVEISKDGGIQWMDITPDSYISSSGGEWKKMDIDISGYSGILSVRFRFVSGSSGNDEGLYIDDISVISEIDCLPTIYTIINKRDFFYGDPLGIEAKIVNPGKTREVDQYIVLVKGWDLFFYPSWSSSIDSENKVIMEGEDYSFVLFDFILGAGTPAGIYTIYSFFTEPDTLNLVSTIDMSRFMIYGGENYPPEPAFEIIPKVGDTNTRFIFDCSASIDDLTDQSLLKSRWDFENDGYWDTAFSQYKVTTHKYDVAGVKKVKIEVK